MPLITLSIDLGEDEPEFKQYDLNLDLTVGEIKVIVSNEYGIPKSQQHLYFNDRNLDAESLKLRDAGVTDNDLVRVTQIFEPRQVNPRPDDEAAVHRQIETIRLQLIQRTLDPVQHQAFAQQAPQLEAALHDPVRFREAFIAQKNDLDQRHAETDEEWAAMNDDMSEEGQAKLYERIRQERIRNDADKAMDDHPELFGRVTMLYVQLEVNGHPVKAFVDSGAQATIMSPSCAEACGVANFIDTRFSGIAKGVGTAKILGRVHLAKIKIGDADELPCSFTVMEGKDVDMLLGLDMLKRYQASIDLKANKLVLMGTVSVPFLGEAELPKHFEEAMENEPTVPGPAGVGIGAQSGALKPQPSTAPAASSKPTTANNFGGQGRTLGAASSSATRAPQTPTNTQQQLPPATQQVPPRPSAPTPGQAQFPQASIETLIGMGATRQQAIELLRACNGNVEYAAGMLFD